MEKGGRAEDPKEQRRLEEVVVDRPETGNRDVRQAEGQAPSGEQGGLNIRSPGQ
jgi:ribulose bisphosphate carboxylase small subunit